MIGKKFGRLTVTRLSEHRSGKRQRLMYYCDCDCGTKDYKVIGESLRSGNTTQCPECAKKSRKESKRRFNKYDLSGEYGIGYFNNTNNEFYFDLSDYELIKNYCWLEAKNGYIYTRNPDSKKLILLHRIILNVQDNEIVDHINHNVKDNRKSNLRIGTQSQNMMNLSLHKNNTSGVSGVSFYNNINKWSAEICVNKDKIKLGLFDNFEDAVKARRKAEEKYFNDWSYKNSVGVYNNDLYVKENVENE